MLCNMR